MKAGQRQIDQIVSHHTRHFFGKRELEPEKEEKEEKKKEAKKEDVQQKGGEKASKDDTEEATAEKEGDQEPSSEEVDLDAEDIKKIKALIAEQDETIEANEEQIAELNKKIKEFKQKLIYQMAENDNTVKRYRKQMEDSK